MGRSDGFEMFRDRADNELSGKGNLDFCLEQLMAYMSLGKLQLKRRRRLELM